MSIYDHDPVDFFANYLKDEFSEQAKAFLGDILDRSGIDTVANAELANEINHLIRQRDAMERKKIFLIVITLLLIFLIVIGGLGLWAMKSKGENVTAVHWTVFILISAAAAAVLCLSCIPAIRRTGQRIAELNSAIAGKIAAAREQLAPLFTLLGWDSITNIIEKVFPHAVFDKFLSRELLEDLMENFGMTRQFTETRSVKHSHSGTLFGYPFLFLNTRSFEWGQKTYTGSLTIRWRALAKDSNGRTRTVTKTEILTASVTKPFPEFNDEKIMISGHDAAPELSFSRSPSSLSGTGGSLFTSIGKSIKMSRLKKFEQNLEDESNYTMLSNRDFELLFCSTDRDDEIAYRLLYTPLAQQYMVKLLNDCKTGFGDDFHYYKSRMITTIAAEHLTALDFSTDPAQPDEYDLRIIMANLQFRFEDFFRRIYFTFAPLLTVPLYLEERPEQQKTDTDAATISEWELESIANYHGESYYRHPESITENLLKVHGMTTNGRKVSALVTACGFKGVPRIDQVVKRGGDGNLHTVNVPWTEYIAVEKTTPVSAENTIDTPAAETLDGRFIRRGVFSPPPA